MTEREEQPTIDERRRPSVEYGLSRWTLSRRTELGYIFGCLVVDPIHNFLSKLREMRLRRAGIDYDLVRVCDPLE